MRGEGRDRGRGRVAEGVVLPDRDHRQAGGGAIEQAAQPGVITAVVRDLEHVHRARVDRNRLGLGVGGQQHPEAMPAREQDDGFGVRVLGRRAGEQLARRPEDVETQRARAQLAPLRDPGRRRARGPCEADQPGAEDREDEALYRNLTEQLLDPARVIGLVMGHHGGRQ
jgi:hypothetical protein